VERTVAKFSTDGKLGLPAKDNIPSMVTLPA